MGVSATRGNKGLKRGVGESRRAGRRRTRMCVETAALKNEEVEAGMPKRKDKHSYAACRLSFETESLDGWFAA